MTLKLLRLLLKATELTSKNEKSQHKMDLQQNSVCSQLDIYPSPEIFYKSAAGTAREIWKVCGATPTSIRRFRPIISSIKYNQIKLPKLRFDPI